jgi:hypothetical protein
MLPALSAIDGCLHSILPRAPQSEMKADWGVAIRMGKLRLIAEPAMTSNRVGVVP